jgi:hypothetical protein
LIFNVVMVLAVLLILRLFHQRLDSVDANVSDAAA